MSLCAESRDMYYDWHILSYGLFASLSYVLGDKMAAYLSDIVPQMIHSLSSEEGVSVC